jgi:CRISPR system Cascade subunit CasA
MTTFNLIEKRWISVVKKDWQRVEVSLVELFEGWETVREIQADNPPTTLAIYRFLLAILHRAYQGPKNVDHWEEIQQDNGKGAIAYLQKWRDRFDLLHSKYPFMQDIALTEDKSVPIYAIHTMSTSKVFSHEHEWSGYSISLPEAARMLVRLQFVDVTSLRAFYPPQSKGNRSAVNTPTINAATILLQGMTVKDTLLANLIRYDPEADMPSVVTGVDLPAWETSYAGQPQKAIPQGYISYLAYPWRRLRLFAEGDCFRQIAITMGNALPDAITIQQWECSIAFQEDKPVRFSLERQLWRDSHCFLHSTEKNHRPRIIDWLAELRAADLIESMVHLQVFGMSANQAKPLGWGIERFSVPLLYVIDTQLGKTLKTIISTAEDHRQIFLSFRGSPYHSLAEALNNNDAGSLSKALEGESRYWATLDPAFQVLLEAIPRDKKVDGNGTTYGFTKLPEWTNTVQKAAREAFTESIASIRNYEARAKALRALEWKLADLRIDPTERAEKKAKAKSKKKATAA